MNDEKKWDNWKEQARFWRWELKPNRDETRQLAKWGAGLFAAGIGASVLACVGYKAKGFDTGFFDGAPLVLGLVNAWLQMTVNKRSRLIRLDLFPGAPLFWKEAWKSEQPGQIATFFAGFPLLLGILGTLALLATKAAANGCVEPISS